MVRSLPGMTPVPPPMQTSRQLILFLLALPLAAQAPSPTSNAEVNPAPVVGPAAETDAGALARLLAGGDAETPHDLLLLQEHVQQLLAKVLPSVVSVPGASGVIVADNLVLTAGHVVRTRGRQLVITLHDGRKVRGETLGADLGIDTGLIKILTPGEYPALEMGSSVAMERGDWCVMLGHPSGQKPGRQAPARLGRVLRPDQRGFLVTDCTMQGGDSGGPLVDMQGRVIGINSRITNDIATNMHVPIDAYKRGWDKLLAAEITGTPSNQRPGRQRLDLGLPLTWQGEEAVLGELSEALQQRGLQAGDVLLKIDGEEIKSSRDVARAMIGFRVDDAVKVEVRRGEEVHEVELVMRRAGR